MDLEIPDVIINTDFKRYISIGITFGTFILILLGIGVFLIFKYVRRFVKGRRAAISPGINVYS